MARTTGPGRRYAGLDPAERTRVRRSALLDAALECFGTGGYASTSVKQICREAGLTERYFYESFQDRAACLHDLYVELTDRLRTLTADAVTGAGEGDDAPARGLAAFVGYLTEDARRAKVVLVEVVGVAPGLEDTRYRVLGGFADMITPLLVGAGTMPDARDALTGVALAGAVNHLLVDWLLGGGRQDPELLVSVCETLFSAARTRLAVERGVPD
ncbi:TetR/AcrR family transcriptional regulator [Prescottella subtropica]|uniref:TetR/AcrR family transcriptional regulator n=1 Tax=Prescottella subtropica TaxID=2545757 RepID=UPI0010F4A94D|nr:TetR/AcrR family transcriptional regulator [Prescottella subtropica]